MKKSNTSKKRGFTFFELMVVITIMTALLSLSLFKYKEFTANVYLHNVALDTALTIREAQSYGVTARESNASGFFHGYGVYFNISTPNKYIFFVDSTNDDFWYNSSAENIREGYLESGYVLSDICVGTIAAPTCGQSEAVVVFKRPSLEANIYITNGGAKAEAARLIFTSPGGDTKRVNVTLTGQIYVES